MLNRQSDEEAIGWVIRLKDGSGEDWEAFTAWLEADPAHLAAYEAAELADHEAGALAPEPARPAWTPAIQPAAAPRPPRRMFLGLAVAASVALFGTWFAVSSGSAYSIETAPGETRTIALEDGSRIEVNGGSRLSLDKDRPRYASLERGEALFHVVHDEAHPFEVEAGGSTLRDLGTVFNVVRSESLVQVAVSEGAVLFEPDGEKQTLKPGMALSKAAGRPAQVARVETDAVGAWREGRLVYSAAAVSQVAADLSRNLGVTVAAADGAAARPFSGVIMLDGSDAEVLGRAAALLGLRLERSGDGWILKTGTGARR